MLSYYHPFFLLIGQLPVLCFEGNVSFYYFSDFLFGLQQFYNDLSGIVFSFLVFVEASNVWIDIFSRIGKLAVIGLFK